MECVICNGEIEQKKLADGTVYWESGNNAEPVKEGRCCDVCNHTVVIPTRLHLNITFCK